MGSKESLSKGPGMSVDTLDIDGLVEEDNPDGGVMETQGTDSVSRW